MTLIYLNLVPDSSPVTKYLTMSRILQYNSQIIKRDIERFLEGWVRMEAILFITLIFSNTYYFYIPTVELEVCLYPFCEQKMHKILGRKYFPNLFFLNSLDSVLNYGRNMFLFINK